MHTTLQEERVPNLRVIYMHNIPADQDVRYSSLPGEATTHPCFALSSDYVPFKPGSDLGIGGECRAVQTLPRVLLVFLLDLRFTRFPLLPDPSVSV